MNYNIEKYNVDYFENGIINGVSLYENYRWIPELTIPMCHSLILNLDIKDTDFILDYGCAKGYVVRAFRLLGYSAYGTDISEYALSTAPNEISKFLFSVENIPKDIHFDWCIAKDVFEHISYSEIVDTIKQIMEISTNLFVVVPLGDGEKYIIPSMELDRTHVIRESLEWWENMFKDCGFDVTYSKNNMGTLKDKWVEPFPNGNGFFIIRKKILSHE